MSNMELSLEDFKDAGFQGSELPRVKRFLPRMLAATHVNQVESLLAYINGLNGRSMALAAASHILTKHTGVVSVRSLHRMSGNTLPSGNAPSHEFAERLTAAHKEVFKTLGFKYPERQSDKGFTAVGRRVYDGCGVMWAICPSEEQAEKLAQSMNAV